MTDTSAIDGAAGPDTVIVTTPADTVVKPAPGWFVSRLAEPTSKGAILSVGMSYVAIAQAAIMGTPLRFLIAAAVSTTFLGVMAFAYKESVTQVRIDTPAPTSDPSVIVKSSSQA